MFLKTLLNRNKELIEVALNMHEQGVLEPDTYVIDLSTLRSNAKFIYEKAHENNIELYFMLKQIGRNPLIATELIKLGYKGAVVVDFREAEIMMDNDIPLGNVGHLVQTPKHLLKRIIKYGTDVMTVYSIEKLIEINDIARELGKHQNIIIKVAGEEDIFYSGQKSGIELDELSQFLIEASYLENINIVGTTSFPCFLYNEGRKKTLATANLETVKKSVEILKSHGISVQQINLPSTTSVSTLDLLIENGGTHGEPGHGLTGTTPEHASNNLIEKPSILYLTEVSHNFRGKSYCYGGGHYRRSHVKNALIRKIDNNYDYYKVTPVENDSIDYYFEMDREAPVSASVIMAFRFQIFVTRSKVAILDDTGHGLKLLGIYDSLGRRLS